MDEENKDAHKYKSKEQEIKTACNSSLKLDSPKNDINFIAKLKLNLNSNNGNKNSLIFDNEKDKDNSPFQAKKAFNASSPDLLDNADKFNNTSMNMNNSPIDSNCYEINKIIIKMDKKEFPVPNKKIIMSILEKQESLIKNSPFIEVNLYLAQSFIPQKSETKGQECIRKNSALVIDDNVSKELEKSSKNSNVDCLYFREEDNKIYNEILKEREKLKKLGKKLLIRFFKDENDIDKVNSNIGANIDKNIENKRISKFVFEQLERNINIFNFAQKEEQKAKDKKCLKDIKYMKDKKAVQLTESSLTILNLNLNPNLSLNLNLTLNHKNEKADKEIGTILTMNTIEKMEKMEKMKKMEVKSNEHLSLNKKESLENKIVQINNKNSNIKEIPKGIWKMKLILQDNASEEYQRSLNSNNTKELVSNISSSSSLQHGVINNKTGEKALKKKNTNVYGYFAILALGLILIVPFLIKFKKS